MLQWRTAGYMGHLFFTLTSPLLRRRQWHPTPVLLPGKSHGWRSLVGCSPWGCYKSDTIERLHFHFSLSSIGEGKGNPLQCSCLEDPRDGGAWWAAISGVAQSRTRLSDLAVAAAAPLLETPCFSYCQASEALMVFQKSQLTRSLFLLNTIFGWKTTLLLLHFMRGKSC